MEEVFFENVQLKPGVDYFIYVGEIKAYGLSEFVRQGLSRRFGRPFSSISICPDILSGYDFDNLLIINPDGVAQVRGGARPMARRGAIGDFCGNVSRSSRVLELVRELVRRQGRVFVWMFESKSELTLLDEPGVELLGPDPELVHQLNDKTWQYETFGSVAPVVDFDICNGREAMLAACQRLSERCGHGVFVSCDYSAGGVSSMVVRQSAEAARRFQNDGCYLVSSYHPHVWDPTVLGVVGNASDVFVAGVADMNIEGGNRFRGSTFPSELSSDIQRRLRDYTAAIGRKLGELGFRGIFGCDFIVDADDDIYFIEVNPRKQGTTMEFCCALEQLLPEGAPNLPELELSALLDDGFPDTVVYPDSGQCRPADLYWGTYNHKIDDGTPVTRCDLPQTSPERTLFAEVVGNGPGGHLILEHVGRDVVVATGTFMGRVVAVAPTRQQMQQALTQGRQELAACISPAADDS